MNGDLTSRLLSAATSFLITEKECRIKSMDDNHVDLIISPLKGYEESQNEDQTRCRQY